MTEKVPWTVAHSENSIHSTSPGDPGPLGTSQCVEWGRTLTVRGRGDRQISSLSSLNLGFCPCP